MALSSSRMWRMLFIVGGALFFAGSYQHPRGEMLEMLRHPVWFRSHFIILIGLIMITSALVIFRRSLPSRSLDRWIMLATIAAALESVEMAVHTISMIDADRLAAGHATPTLTAHLSMATVIYPIYGVIMIGFIFKAQKAGVMGSPWIGWIGMIGALAHGMVMGLMWLGVPGVRILFPIAAISLSLWYILAGFWPAREQAGTLHAVDSGVPSAIA